MKIPANITGMAIKGIESLIAKVVVWCRRIWSSQYSIRLNGLLMLTATKGFSNSGFTIVPSGAVNVVLTFIFVVFTKCPLESSGAGSAFRLI